MARKETVMMSWHQRAASRRSWLLRNKKAHILKDDVMRSLCGAEPVVYVNEEHAHNPANNTCKKCLAILNLITERISK